MLRTIIFLGLFFTYLSGDALAPVWAQAKPDAPAGGCGPLGTVHMRTTLYFGLTYPSGTVTESQWRVFLRDQVTPRFPDGFTMWEADGQWRQANGRIVRERSKVMLVVHEDKAAVRSTLAAMVGEYKRAFQQQSVLWETTSVCAAF